MSLPKRNIYTHFFVFSNVTANLSFILLGHCYCRWPKVCLPMCWDKTYGRMSPCPLSHKSNLSIDDKKTEVHYAHNKYHEIIWFCFHNWAMSCRIYTFITLNRYYFCQLQIKMSIWISHLHLCQKNTLIFESFGLFSNTKRIGLEMLIDLGLGNPPDDYYWECWARQINVAVAQRAKLT